MTEEKAASQISGPLWAASRVYNLIWWKGERLGGWSSKQAGSEWRCPRVHVDSILSPFFSSTSFNSSQPFPPQLPPPSSLQCLDGFKMDLHFPGHLGWWSPLPQGLERPLELLLEKKHKNNVLRKKSIYEILSLFSSSKWFGIPNRSNKSALWNIFQKNYNNEFPQEGTTTSCQHSVKHDMRILPNVRFPTRAALLEWFDS